MANKRVIGAVACILVLVGGVGFLWWWTLGLSAFTSYSYALEGAGRLPRPAPDITLVDQSGRVRTLKSLRGRYVLLHAFYGSCGTTCPIVLAEIRDVYARLDPARRSRLEVVSLTVDPEDDTLARLRDLWSEQGEPDGWIMAQAAGGSTERAAKELGIWVFRRKDGIINHAAYLFLIDRRGQIVRVITPGLSSEDIRRALEGAV